VSYLRTHRNLDRIRKLIHALENSCSTIDAETNILGSSSCMDERACLRKHQQIHQNAQRVEFCTK
jgi:hypothetical protein